jgi:hypothetical protein
MRSLAALIGMIAIRVDVPRFNKGERLLSISPAPKVHAIPRENRDESMSRFDSALARFTAALDRLEAGAEERAGRAAQSAGAEAELSLLKDERERLLARIAGLEEESRNLAGLTEEVEDRLDSAITEIREALRHN